MSETVESTQAPLHQSNEFKHLLRIYYKRLFPHQLLQKWLAYEENETSIFKNREISFTLENDIYMRYLSYGSLAEFEKDIIAKVPEKIDIGAVYNVEPKFRGAMTAIQRELVFDVDLTDYDKVRTCCSGANVCNKCWKFMVVACKILDVALRTDFGFQHILWVFSGRRGVHCWVCDHTARHLSKEARSAVAEYLNLLTGQGGGSENSLARVNIGMKMHTSVKRAYHIIAPAFKEIIIEDQDLFSTPDGLKKLMSLIPDNDLKMEFDKALKQLPANSNSAKIWDTFCRHFENVRTSGKGSASRKCKFIIEEVQLAFLYPRLDINVSKGLNHLLKAPFCVHPKTGKICVPFRPSTVSDFDPVNVPTLNLLMEEINAFDKENQEISEGDSRRIQDIKKTSMYKGIKIFEDFLRKLTASLIKSKIEF